MEKLKFALQVFTAIAALPVLTVMELNHSIKNVTAQQEISKQETINTAEGYYFNINGKINAPYIKNNTAVKAAND